MGRPLARNATGRGRGEAPKIATIFPSVLDPNTLWDADSRPEGGTSARFEWENWNERLRCLAPVYFSQGSESHFTVNLGELIDGVR
jgi:hypothetical protein